MAETLNQLWARAIVEELVRGGVQHAVVCPGSRSTPLALACADQPGLKTWSIIDERSAAFFALGVAKATGRPAAVVATSGTAGANFYPAVIEAELSRVPMVVLTADRPPELQGWGAPQTIDQRALFGSHVRAFIDAGIPEPTNAVVLQLRAQASRAVAMAMGDARGPVHVNVPFREPLAPDPEAPPLTGLSEAATVGRGDAPFTQLAASDRTPNAAAIAKVAERVRRAEKGVIVCGPRDQSDGFTYAVHALGKALGYPVLAEAASNVRFGRAADAIGAYDSLLRSERFAKAHVPEVVLRFGGGLTPKISQQWLDQSGAFTVQFSETGQLVDPQHSASMVIEGDLVAACTALTKAAASPRGPEWRKRFEAAEARARHALSEAISQDARLTEPRVACEVVSSLPAQATLFVSSSMPIRDLDAFAVECPVSVRVLCNRGANGIDGVTSAALGAAAALQKPTVLLTGDVAFIHDLGAFVGAARNGVSLCAVVVNNGGGGIFDFLPVASRTPHFDRLFSTSHSVSFEAAAAALGASYRAPANPQALREAVRAGVEGGLHLIEVKVDRSANVEVHRQLFAAVDRGLEENGSWN